MADVVEVVVAGGDGFFQAGEGEREQLVSLGVCGGLSGFGLGVGCRTEGVRAGGVVEIFLILGLQFSKFGGGLGDVLIAAALGQQRRAEGEELRQ